MKSAYQLSSLSFKVSQTNLFSSKCVKNTVDSSRQYAYTPAVCFVDAVSVDRVINVFQVTMLTENRCTSR